jgi:hypothetical protein
MANFADAVYPVQNLGGAVSFPVAAAPEEAGVSTAIPGGTPVQIKAADGGLQNWDGTTVTNGIAGILAELSFNNLASTGAGAPVGFSPILGPGSVVGNYGANPNQPSAVITPPMVPMSDGRLRFWTGAPGTVFIAKKGTSATVTPVATALTDRSQQWGLTKDTGNAFWYVDTNKTGASAVLQVVDISPLEPVGTVGGHLMFVFLNAAVQIFA